MSEDKDWCEGPSVSKRSRSDDCIIHCTDDNTKLICPVSLDSWKSLLIAAQIRGHSPLLRIAQSLKEGEIPEITYHRRCRSVFTLKKSLETICDKPTTFMEKHRPTAIRQKASTSVVLEAKCIFCNKVKYKDHGRRESLVKCQELRADKKIRDVALQKQDSHILSVVCSQELVAAEAHYHITCYKSYTRQRPDKSKNTVNQETESYSRLENQAYQHLFKYIRDDVIEKAKLVTVAELTAKLVSLMKELDVKDVLDQSKKHIRRRLEREFGSSVQIFANNKGKLLFLPDTLSITQLAMEKKELEDQINILQECASDCHKSLKQAALQMRAEIKQMNDEISWPPQASELNAEAHCIPPSVQMFLKFILTGSVEDTYIPSQNVLRYINSFGQDLVYAVSGGKHITPKHILLPFAVKSLTGNVELIKILNRLGHGVSYSKTLEIDTAFALHKLSSLAEFGTVLPEQINPYIPTTLVYDNIDRLEETLSGEGTSHRVNGIAVQQQLIGPVYEKPKVLVEKTKKRSLDVVPANLPAYNAGERCGPPIVNIVDMDQNVPLYNAWLKNLIWFMTRQSNSAIQTVSSWTGFNIQVRKDVPVTQDVIGYLPTIDAPATSLTTMYEILCQSIKIKEALGLVEIVCVFDQAMYAKAVEVIWKHPIQFKSIVIRLGAFHTTMMFMSVIGKRFADAGLRDLCIEAGIIAEGSVSSVLEGRHYNRGVRLHKLMYEALMRLVWDGFLPFIQLNHPANTKSLDELLESISHLREETSPDSFAEVFNSELFKDIAHLFQMYMEYLRHDNGSMSTFWMSYLDMVNVLMSFLRASREGNWSLHLASVQAIIPWCFAYDRINYGRYLPWYLQNMLSLPNTHPQVHAQLDAGGFAVQIGSQNTFGKIPMDQTIEETVNKDTQTPGGTKGFSTKPDTIRKYYMTADYRSTCIRQLRQMVDISRGSFTHPDLTSARILKDETAVLTLVDMLQNNWTNPFCDDTKELGSLSTAVAAPPAIVSDLLNAHTKGLDAYNTFKHDRLTDSQAKKFHDPLPKLKLKTFSSMKKTKMIKSGGKEVMLRADKNLFGQMSIIAQNRKLDMKSVLEHPLGPLPWSLATCDGALRKTNKASLAKELEKNSLPAETIQEPSACIIDAMSIIQKLTGNHNTFSELAESIFNMIMAESFLSIRIDVVFDVYQDISIKDIERTENREASEATFFKNISGGHKIQQWRKFLRGQHNKTGLIVFLCREWRSESYRRRLGEKILFVAYEKECYKVTAAGVEEVQQLKCSHEEADTRVVLHADHAARDGFKSIVISSLDTDVLLLFLAHQIEMAPVYIKRGTQNRTHYVDIRKLHHSLGRDVCLSLPGLHAFTGCDTVEAFTGRGKLFALKLVKTHAVHRNTFNQLGVDWEITPELYDQLETFTCQLYGSKTIANINTLRYNIFCAKGGQADSQLLPPCRDTLYKHIERANYQAGIWKRCLQQYPDIPNPCGHGWKTSDNSDDLTIDWMTGLPAPQAVLELLSCKCTRSCVAPKCTCVVNGLKCTDMCKLQTCTNQSNEVEDEMNAESSDDQSESDSNDDEDN